MTPKRNSSNHISTAIITAAGSSQRMGGTKKEFIEIDGKPLIVHTTEQFLKTALFTSIIVTASQESYTKVQALLSHFPEVTTIIGGNERQESVYRALQALKETNPDTVLIHDGARPWVSESTIIAVQQATEQFGSAAPAITPQDTMKVVDQDGYIREHLVRSQTRAIQTPQGFAYREITSAHETAATSGVSVTDDTELYGMYVGPVYTVPGDPENVKITYQNDIRSTL